MVAPPGPDPLERYAVIDGSGSLARAVARLLRCEGVRWVEAGPWAADSVDAELRRGGGATPDLVVLVRHGSVDPRLGEPWRRRGVPLLPLVARGQRVVVGPWLSGSPSRPCLGCLVASPGAVDGPAEALVAAGAGLAAMVALAGLRGHPLPAGVSVEVHGPWPNVLHRRWRRDPDCGFHDEAVAPRQRPTVSSTAR